MIYLVYLTKESGELLWSFRHPLAPTDLIAKVAGKDDVLISGFISAISGFGSETLGDKLQSIDFEKVRLYFRYMYLDDTPILTTVIADREDAPEAIWNTLQEFFNKNKKELMELADELSFLDAEKQIKTVTKLNKSMLSLLESKKRGIDALAKRDNRTVLIGLLPSLVVFFAMYFVTDWANTAYDLIRTRTDVLLGIIIVLMFIIPSIIMGIIIGFKEGARKGGMLLSAVGILLLSVRYFEQLMDWASSYNVLYLLPVLLIIVIFILGSAMGSLGASMAWYFVERKTLTPPTEKEAFEAIDKLELSQREADKLLEGIEDLDKTGKKTNDKLEFSDSEFGEDLDLNEFETSQDENLDDIFKDDEEK